MRNLNFFIVVLVFLSIMGCDGQLEFIDRMPVDRVTSVQQDSVPLVYILNDPSDSLSSQTTEQLVATLNYAKIPYQTKDVFIDTLGAGSLKSAAAGAVSNRQIDSLEIPPSVETICLVPSGSGVPDSTIVPQLTRFVGEGRSLVMTNPVPEPSWGFLQGVAPDAYVLYDTTASGVIFYQELFPGFQGEERAISSGTHVGFSRSVFKDGVEIMASARNRSSYPVLLKNRVGQGNVFLVNSFSLSDKENRGMLFSLVLRSLQGIPYMVKNVGTVFLDDFPAAVYNEKMPPIEKEYGATQSEFVSKIWWPDMKMLADSFGVNYTVMLTYNYNTTTVPPFTFEHWHGGEVAVNGDSIEASSWLARDVKESRHELAFHGYNHTSLMEEEWPNKEFMKGSIEAARKKWQIGEIGELPSTYVPPHNYIDSTGLMALQETFPKIRYMASTYLGIRADGGDREFGWDPVMPTLFDYPRASDGYYNTPSSLYRQHNLQLYTGIWTHFLHPDDVYDIGEEGLNRYGFEARNPQNLGWQNTPGRGYGLYDLFRERLKYTNKHYPLIEYKTAKQAVPPIQSWRNQRTFYRKDSTSLMVFRQAPNSKDSVSDWFMYVPDHRVDLYEREIAKQSKRIRRSSIWNGYLYQFRSKQDTLRFPLIEREHENKGKTLDDLAREISEYEQQRQEFESGVTGYTPEVYDKLQQQLASISRPSEELQRSYIEASLAMDRVDNVIPLLEDRLVNNKDWKPMTLARLMTFNGWQGQSGDVWSTLEKRWKKFPNAGTMRMKEHVVDELGWPDTTVQNRWFKREYNANPNNPKLLRRYIRRYESPEKWPDIRKKVDRLIERNPDSDTLYAYLVQRSFWYGESDSTILSMVKQFPTSAHAQLKPFADEFAMMFARSGDYTRAEYWGQKAHHLPVTEFLSWYIADDRYYAFQKMGQKVLQSYPEVDSLRSLVGSNLFYEGYESESYPILYPLFKRNYVSSDLKTAVYNQMQAQSYDRKKDLYQKYPAFFPDSMEKSLSHEYIRREAMVVQPSASVERDNFDNDVARVGLTASWGRRQEYRHRLTSEELWIRSRAGTRVLSGRMHRLHYTYQMYPNISGLLQASVGGGVQYAENRGRFFPSLTAAVSGASLRSFTSTTLELSPEYTNSAIDQNIHRLQAEVYREDQWWKQRIRTALSGRTRYYTDNVLFYEGSLKAFVPVLQASWLRISPLGQFSYASATEARPSGVPYWTPNNLQIRGGGLELQVGSGEYDFTGRLEGMRKHNNETGVFTTVNASASWNLNPYWSVELQGRISTSELYRSNSAGLSVTMRLPRKLESRSVDYQNSSSRRKLSSVDQRLYTTISKEGVADKEDDAVSSISTDHKLIGVVQDTGGTRSLYDIPLILERKDGRTRKRLRTYFNGEFYAKGLSPGPYMVKHDEDRLERSIQLVPGQQQIDIPQNSGIAIEDTIRFSLQNDASSSQDEGPEFTVKIITLDSLDTGLEMLETYRKQSNQPLQLRLDTTKNNLHITTRTLSTREEAGELQDKMHTTFGSATVITRLTDANLQPIRLQVQIASYKNRKQAEDLLEDIRSREWSIKPGISIDPVLGVYEVVSSEFDIYSKAMDTLEELQEAGYGDAFIQFYPAKTEIKRILSLPSAGN